jgi:hypothetical protein
MTVSLVTGIPVSSGCVNIFQILVDTTSDRVAMKSIVCLPRHPGTIQLAVKEEKDWV